ncbi:hypothetical protein BUALT_Bualt15G0056100 [Buddleja alternifolia]|uniref:Protein kinase domain-containing protein n=1 Tax=Buddleja alternifolia TaxID=168488 RepID=A0AAV6WL22_9LAMI|nr:hypothetical protein BUALT_Bualt15G0056100 [Buddleja alternifolia]
MASRILTVHLDQVINNACFMMIKTLILLHLLILIPFANPLSFNFTTFTPNDLNITYESSAYPANNTIQLTKNQRDLKTTTTASIGRAFYAKPIHLWDKSSGNLTNFSTNFSFIVNSLNVNIYRDGFAFFIAPNGSSIPNNVTKGDCMGLTPDDEALNSTKYNPFVAVEFDTYSNTWDPWGEHVGIDISSMRSVANVSWWSIMDGRRHEARINYDSGSRNLSLLFTGYINDTTILGSDTTLWQRLSYIVDLREHLPEFVTIGFSAATGNASALHSIYSWSFSSSLEINASETGPGISVGPTSDSNVAVKRVSRGSRQGIKEYASEVRIISRLRHKNLVQLLGWCHEKKELLLVQEFMPNGSLDSHLFKGRSLLSWGFGRDDGVYGACDLRLSIRQAILVLNSEVSLPVLPLRMPVPTYCTPALDTISSPYGTVVSKNCEIYDL